MTAKSAIVIPDIVFRSLGITFCLTFLSVFCCTWQSNTMDYFSPTGHLKDVSDPICVWVCLFIDVSSFVLVNLLTLITCYRIFK